MSTVIVGHWDKVFLENFEKSLNGIKSKLSFYSAGVEIIKAAENLKPDLFILSTRLEDMDGLKVIDEIRNGLSSSVAIAVLMEDDSIVLQEEVVKRNILCSLLEPVLFQDLKDIINKIGVKHV